MCMCMYVYVYMCVYIYIYSYNERCIYLYLSLSLYIYIYTYTYIHTHFFSAGGAYNENANFRTFPKAMSLLIRSMTGEGWNEIMHDLSKSKFDMQSYMDIECVDISLSLYMCVYIYIYIHTYMCICVYKYIYIYIYIHTIIYTHYIYIYIYMYRTPWTSRSSTGRVCTSSRAPPGARTGAARRWPSSSSSPTRSR